MENENTSLKYRIVKDYIVELIEKEKLSPDERIPSEPELSRMFDVSIITVRRALNELVNESRIYRIKGKGSFVSGSVSRHDERGMAGNNIISFIMSAKQGSQDGSLMSMIRGIQSYLGKHGYSLIIEHSNECLETEKQIINRLIDERISGLIYFSVDPDRNVQALKKLREKNIPFVLIDRYAKTYPTNSVVSDNFGSVYGAVEYLMRSGHKKIAFITNNLHLSSESERLDGYCRALENAGLQSKDEMIFSFLNLSDGRLASMIKNGDVTALMAVNDIVAIEVMKICEQNNIKIPEDLSLIGFDDIRQAAYQKVPLTSVKQYFDMMGREAAKTLVKTIKNSEMACRKIELPTKLVIRKSVACEMLNS